MLGEMVPADYDRLVPFVSRFWFHSLGTFFSPTDSIFRVGFSRFRLYSYFTFYNVLSIRVVLELPICMNIIMYPTVPLKV